MKKFIFTFFLLQAALCSAAYDPIALFLTWQRSPETTMVVNWLTAMNRHDDRIEYRKTGETSWRVLTGSHQKMPEEAPYFIHTAELKSLTPGTEYEFRTGQDALIYKFLTMPDSNEESIRFVVGGDMYHDEIEYCRKTNREAAKTNPHFALVGGDIAYAAKRKSNLVPNWLHSFLERKQKIDRWMNWLIAWKEDMVTPDGHLIPLLPVIGNHDTTGRFNQTPSEAPFFYTLFPMPGEQGCNVLDFGNYMSIFMLDSSHTHPIEGDQTFWLWEEISKRALVPHKFAFYHVPAYPSVRSYSNEPSTEIRKHWVPLFETYGLTAAFEHHDHAYKRTYPIKQNQINPNGVLYFGDGAWGVKHPRRPKDREKRWYLARTASQRHFILAQVRGSTQEYKAISSDGILIDKVVN